MGQKGRILYHALGGDIQLIHKLMDNNNGTFLIEHWANLLAAELEEKSEKKELTSGSF